MTIIKSKNTKKPNKQTFWAKLLTYLKEFNEYSGIHGLRYLTEGRSKCETVFWIFVLMLSLAGCLYMSWEILDQYQNNPVIVTFANRDTKTSEIPFPAVTLCPESKSSATLFNYTDIYYKIVNGHAITPEQEKKFEYLTIICNKNNETFNLNSDDKNINAEFYHVVDRVKPALVLYGTFMNSDFAFETSPYFTNVITDAGICYTFNILDRSLIYKDDVFHFEEFNTVGTKNIYNADLGYTEDVINVYPFRGISTPVDKGLSMVVLQSSLDFDYACTDFLRGYRVLLHDPRDVPRITRSFLSVSLNKAVTVAIKPKMIKISEDVKKFSPEKRNCYLQYERDLQHFKIYTQSNCLLECLTNYTLNKCGCVTYYMPRNSSTKICKLKDFNCIASAAIIQKLEELQNDKNLPNCDCKPSCTVLTYNVETSVNDYSYKDFIKNTYGSLNDSDSNIGWDLSIVSIYLGKEQFTAMEKNELYGVSNLISNFGGLLGLFTGFSLISSVEIIYFCSIRLFYNIKLFGSWWGQKK